jgi:hypothetical protein
MHRSYVMVGQPILHQNEHADWASGGSIGHLVAALEAVAQKSADSS